MFLIRIPQSAFVLVPGLPSPQLRRRVEQQNNVQDEAVPDPDEQDEFRRGEEDGGAQRAEAAGEEEACGAGRDVAERVDDRVARVAERGGRLAVARDDEVRVLDQLPKGLARHAQAEAPRPANARKQVSEQAAEEQAVQDVREGVGVEELLRGLLAPGVADPDAEAPARTSPEPPLPVQLKRRRREQRDDDEDGRGALDRSLCLSVVPRPVHQSRTMESSACARRGGGGACAGRSARGQASQYEPWRWRRSSQVLQSSASPVARRASRSGVSRRPRSVSVYSTCGGLPPRSRRSMSESRTMSRRRSASVRLLMGWRRVSKSVVRRGPRARSRTMSIVHLSPTTCSAPHTGQPSPSRRRIERPSSSSRVLQSALSWL